MRLTFIHQLKLSFSYDEVHAIIDSVNALNHDRRTYPDQVEALEIATVIDALTKIVVGNEVTVIRVSIACAVLDKIRVALCELRIECDAFTQKIKLELVT